MYTDALIFSCPECDGQSLCEHGHEFRGCKVCSPYHCVHGKLKCVTCGTAEMCNGCNLYTAMARNNYLCSYCNPNSTLVKEYERTRPEHRVNEYFGKKYTSNDILVYPIGSYASFSVCLDNGRPDLVIDFENLNPKVRVFIETDEKYHSGYDQSCEWKSVCHTISRRRPPRNIVKIIFVRNMSLSSCTISRLCRNKKLA